jgi:hypothetical protein
MFFGNSRGLMAPNLRHHTRGYLHPLRESPKAPSQTVQRDVRESRSLEGCVVSNAKTLQTA